MTRQERIQSTLATFEPAVLDVVDESHKHKGGRESHYNVTLVTGVFAGLSRVERHRRVHALLGEEFASGLHALTLTLRTPEEQDALGGATIASPNCHGGSKE